MPNQLEIVKFLIACLLIARRLRTIFAERAANVKIRASRFTKGWHNWQWVTGLLDACHNGAVQQVRGRCLVSR